MITMHARPRQINGRMNIIAIARRFVLTNVSRANNNNNNNNNNNFRRFHDPLNSTLCLVIKYNI